jgi:uncharacterized membrane protein
MATAWIGSGNVPVKVGVIVSFIGVAFLLKYAIDRELLFLPIEFRLLGVALAGLVMIVLGWRLRSKTVAYALSLQGGGTGIIFLTIFAAFRIWDLIPATLAFALLVALEAFTGALAVLQKSRTLIVFGVVGGFLAPVLASTGQGSHVALFSYYLVINATILGVAWFRAWRELNLVGFVFTFVIGSLWGYRYYRPELLASTEPFLVLYFLFYQAIAILYALRQMPGRAGLVDGTLVFGTPVIAFTLQAALMRNTEYGLALSAAALAVFYALTATWLQRREGIKPRVLVESFIALSVAFATLAIPLALDARWTSAAWALEGAALVWTGTRQARHLATLAGTTLLFFSGLSFMLSGWTGNAAWPVLNGNVLGGVMISLGALFAARRLQGFGPPPLANLYRLLAWGLFAWGVCWWFGTGIMEIDDRVNNGSDLHILLLFLALSSGAFAWLGRTIDWSMPRHLTLLFLPALILLALMYPVTHRHFLLGLGWLAWPLAFAVQYGILRLLDHGGENMPGKSLASSWHIGTLLLLTALLALEVHWRVSDRVSGAWSDAALTAVPGLVALLVWKLQHKFNWPVRAHLAGYLGTSLFLVGWQATFLAWLCVALPGDPGSLPYIPLLNPFDLATLFALLTALLSLAIWRREELTLAPAGRLRARNMFRLLLVIAFFVLTTAALVRGVHHYSGVAWHFDRLYDSVIVQTSLAIYWGVLGFAGMIGGARSARRTVWIAGACFMALVVIKLFVVDLGNSGTIERIISFIGIGVLLLVVGYFAPAPPRYARATAGTAVAQGDGA